MSNLSRRLLSYRLLMLLCLASGSLLIGLTATADAHQRATPCIAGQAPDELHWSIALEPPEDDEAADESEGAPAESESEDTQDKDQTDSASDSDEEAPAKEQSAESKSSSEDEDSAKAVAEESTEAAATQAAEAEDKSNSPQVEVYIPSVTGLVDAYRKSHTARLSDAFAGMVPKLENETDDGLDFAAALAILERIANWPDTSIALTTYTQDREGRPRWAVRVDWPITDLRDRIQEILDDESARKLLKDITLQPDGDAFTLEMPDVVLAVLKPHGEGSLIAATAELLPPELLFGQKATGEDRSRAARGQGTLVYCRLNMEAGDEGEKQRSMLSSFSIASDVRYAASIDAQGQWKERFNVRWNPLIGLGIKTMLKKTSKPFDCPREAYAAGAMHLGIGEGLADSLADLDSGTIGSRAGGDMAFAVLPGQGFLPIPDIYYQFHVRRIDRIKKEIRDAIKKDNERRKDDDILPAWHEEEIHGKVVFWRDPSVDQGGSFSLATFRTVLFFEFADRDRDGAQDRLIIASTSMQAEDALRRWRELRRTPKDWMRLPDSSKTHWQIVLNWKAAYELIQPYLSVFAATAESSESAPTAAALADALSSSTIDVKIEFAGLDVRHAGPVPIGAAFVPGITFASLSATADPGSEAARERLACRNLRVLHHHASLFKKDYGRWPATVAELDGYVDFASHPHLLNIRPKDEGLLKGFVSMFTGDKRREAVKELEAGEIDDTLYEIEWDEAEWKLKFRPNEFVNHLTIYIDHEGEIHRVPRPDSKIKDNDADEQKDEKTHKELAQR